MTMCGHPLAEQAG